MKNNFKPFQRGKKQQNYVHHRLKTRSDVPAAMFKTPEEVAAEDVKDELPSASMTTDERSHMPTKNKNHKSFKEWLTGLSKKQWIIIAVVSVLILGGAAYGAYYLWFRGQPVPIIHKIIKKSKPKPAVQPVSTLTGLPIANESINDRPVTGIMIENSTFARPQSGLNQAGVVFEAIAEGGITRFLTLWQDTQPDYVGPIRSVRPYYIAWALGFDAPIAHVGGSAEALALMKSWHVKDLDQSFNSAYYTRITARFAPHNVYTSLARLNELEAKKGYGKSVYTGFARKKEEPKTGAAITARSIDFTISSALYNPHFDYDSATNSYKRSIAGKPQTDERSGAQISPKVVIGLVTTNSLEADHLHNSYGVVGNGTVYVFQDGTVTTGTWDKASNVAQIVFKDANGAVIKLNPGQTWISAVSAASAVKYAP